MKELIKLNSVRRMIALSVVMLVTAVTLACSCQLGDLTKLATQIAPTEALVVRTVAPKPTEVPSPTPKPTPVPTAAPVVEEMALHTNEEAGINIQYPAAWFMDSDTESSYFAADQAGLGMMSPAGGPVFAVFAGPLADIEADTGTIESAEQLLDALIAETGFIPEGGEVGEYETLRPDVIVVPASWVDETTEQLWHVLLGATLSGERAGVMVGVTVADAWQPHLDIFRAMAGSVELFEPTVVVAPTEEVVEPAVGEVPGTVMDLEGDLEFASYRGWIDEEGDFEIAAEVTNVGDQTYNTYIDVYWQLLDINGDILLEDNSYLDRPTLAPGEVSSFWSFSWGSDLETGTISDVTAFKMWLEVSDLERSEVMVEVVEHSGSLTEDSFVVEGTIRNNLDSTVSDLYVHVTLYDASGNVVNVLYGWPDSDVLAPGEESTFTLSAWSSWEGTVDYGNVFVTGNVAE